MNKGVIIGGVAVVGAGLGYLMLRKKVGTLPPPNPAGKTTRIDNANQPWYNGIMTWGQSQADNIAKNPTRALQQASSATGINIPDVTSIKSLADVTGIFSGLFGSSNNDSVTQQQVSDPHSVDGGYSDNSGTNGSPDSYNLSADGNALPSSDVNQSNLLGIGDPQYLDSTLPDPAMVIMADSSDPGTVDYSNADGYSQDDMSA